MGSTHAGRRHRLVIAGGGVAALEAALASAALVPDVEVVLLTSARDFVVRSTAVREPFTAVPAKRTPIASITDGSAIDRIHDDLAIVDPATRLLTTRSGQTFEYDALIVAVGATPAARYEHAITIDPELLGAQLRGTIDDIDRGTIGRLAFVAPPRMSWPIPLYELALLAALRGARADHALDATVVTSELRPLGAFGTNVSVGVAALLRARRVRLMTAIRAEVPNPGTVVVERSGARLEVDRVIALPELFGPAIPGLPQDEHGFHPIDDHCAVRGVTDVFAIGDAANFALKHGGVAAQMAVTAAEAIAARFGAPVHPRPLAPMVRGVLWTGDAPRFLSAARVGGHAYESTFTERPTWDPAAKVDTTYLAPYLDREAPAPLAGGATPTT